MLRGAGFIETADHAGQWRQNAVCLGHDGSTSILLR